MGTKFAVNEEVWVPSTYLSGDQPFALMLRTVRGNVSRSVVVDDSDGQSVQVSSRRVHHKRLGFLVLRIGDLVTERALLDPLAKSILQYLRLLIPDEEIHTLHARTATEIERYMKVQADAISHVILIGHGTQSAIKVVEGELTGQEFAALFGGTTAKRFVSLACKTGRAEFARALSATPLCTDLVAPFREAHGAAASLYFQCLLHSHLLQGHEFHTAARLADKATEGTLFRHWRDGAMR